MVFPKLVVPLVSWTSQNVKKLKRFFKNKAWCLANVAIIWNRASAAEKDMGNAAAPASKEPTAAENGQTQEENHEFYIAKKLPKSCCSLKKTFFTVLSFITIFICVAEIAVAVSTAIATKTFSIQQSGRLVAMIILAVTAAIAMSMIVYAVLAIFKKHSKPLHAAVVVLVVLGIIQAIICSVSVNLTTEDEANLGMALFESFKLAREENPRHVKLWSMTQSDLNCCGIYGSSDYRSPTLPVFFPPDVPISCCPAFNADRSELVQERDRERCKAKREYYSVGCRGPVVEVFRNTACLVLSVTIVLIVLEILLAILGSLISRKHDKDRHITPIQEIDVPKAKS